MIRPRPVVDAVHKLAARLALIGPALARADSDYAMLDRLDDLERALNFAGVALGLERRSILIRGAPRTPRT